jgi:hypothetical protein
MLYFEPLETFRRLLCATEECFCTAVPLSTPTTFEKIISCQIRDDYDHDNDDDDGQYHHREMSQTCL